MITFNFIIKAYVRADVKGLELTQYIVSIFSSAFYINESMIKTKLGYYCYTSFPHETF